MKKLLLIIVSIAMLASCGKESKLLKEELKPDNIADLSKRIAEDEKFSKEDLDIFLSGFSYFSSLKDSLKGKTVGDIITLERARQLRNSKEAVIQSMTRVEIMNSLIVGIDSLERAKEAGQEIIIFNFKFQNVSIRDFKNVKGFIDLFNEQGILIKRYIVEMNNIVPTGKMVSLRYPFAFDVNSERDRLVADNWQKYTKIWKPTLVEFTDGKKLTLNQN
jgi:hypothetical protein